jgi:hypothetical protein
VNRLRETKDDSLGQPESFLAVNNTEVSCEIQRVYSRSKAWVNSRSLRKKTTLTRNYRFRMKSRYNCLGQSSLLSLEGST